MAKAKAIKGEPAIQIDFEKDAGETTHSKGLELEEEFARYMKNELKWHVRVGAHLKGKINDKGAKVDIIGHRLDDRGRRLKSIGRVYLIICGFLLIISVTYGFANDWEGDYNFLAIFGVIMSGIFEVGGFIALIFSERFNQENVLVECKNLKNKVTINHIEKTIREMKDYKATGDKEHKFTKHYFVSSNGYVENALKFADEHGIACFEKKDGKFVRSEYWNNV